MDTIVHHEGGIPTITVTVQSVFSFKMSIIVVIDHSWPA